jgi:hypothetical protein
MNAFDRHNNYNDQPRALAIFADQNDIAKTLQISFWMAIAMFLVRTLNNINPFKAQANSRTRKLKLQLLTMYAAPSLFFFGASGIVLIIMYLCLFEMVLAAAAHFTAQK